MANSSGTITSIGDLKQDDYSKIKKAAETSSSAATMTKTDGYAIINNKKANTWKISVDKVQLTPLPDPTPRKYSEDLDLGTSPPEVVQNNHLFPYLIGELNGINQYSYEMNYSEIGLDTDLKKVRKTINLDVDGPATSLLKQTSLFNRFRIPSLGDAFHKGFGHVFFTRPKCNIMTYDGQYRLTDAVKDDMTFQYGFTNHKNILKQLCGQSEFNHDFMLYLHNKAQGFDISDKTLETSTYGTNLMGHSIQYGRTSEKSKTAGNFTVPYAADRNMHIYNLHNYWLKYIAGVYRGRYQPDVNDIVNKVLDYACACFYFVTAEDFETIIYWTKLFGVFPTSTPDGVMSWKAGGPILNPEPTITYAFSWRSEDNDPKILVDFNKNALYGNTSDFKYVQTYEKDRYGLGDTWVEAPFVELRKNTAGITQPKLRWRRSTK